MRNNIKGKLYDFYDLNTIKESKSDLHTEIKSLFHSTKCSKMRDYILGKIEYIPNSDVLEEIRKKYNLEDDTQTRIKKGINKTIQSFDLIGKINSKATQGLKMKIKKDMQSGVGKPHEYVDISFKNNEMSKHQIYQELKNTGNKLNKENLEKKLERDLIDKHRMKRFVSNGIQQMREKDRDFVRVQQLSDKILKKHNSEPVFSKQQNLTRANTKAHLEHALRMDKVNHRVYLKRDAVKQDFEAHYKKDISKDYGFNNFFKKMVKGDFEKDSFDMKLNHIDRQYFNTNRDGIKTRNRKRFETGLDSELNKYLDRDEYYQVMKDHKSDHYI